MALDWIAAAAACTAITTAPITINNPGCYVLANDITVFGAVEALAVRSDNVTIYGGGHCLYGSTDPNVSSYGVNSWNASHVAVVDMCIRGFRVGVIASRSSSLTISDIAVVDSDIQGASFNGVRILADHTTIDGNLIRNIGGDMTGPHTFAHIVYILGDHASITDNDLYNPAPVGNGEGVCIALYEGAESRITGNRCITQDRPEFGRIFALWVDPDTTSETFIDGNTIVNADYGYAPWGSYGRNTFVNIACSVAWDGEWSSGAPLVVGFENVEAGETAWDCRDLPSLYEPRFYTTRQSELAYSIYLSYPRIGNPRANPYLTARMAWLIVAAQLGHGRAAIYEANARSAGAITSAMDACAAALQAATQAPAQGLAADAYC